MRPITPFGLHSQAARLSDAFARRGRTEHVRGIALRASALPDGLEPVPPPRELILSTLRGPLGNRGSVWASSASLAATEDVPVGFFSSG